MHLDPIIAFVAPIRELLPYLAAIAITITLIAVTFHRATRKSITSQEPARPEPLAPAGTPLVPAAVIEKEPPPEIVAVIAAAVATVTGRTYRIVSIRHQASLWEKVGRQSVLTSHRIR